MRAFVLALMLIAPSAAALATIPNGCTQAALASVCVQEGTVSCMSYTTASAGVTGVATASFAGVDVCGSSYVVARATVGTVSVGVVWWDAGTFCTAWVETSAGTTPVGCPAGQRPPDPGWGHLLP